MLPAGSKDYPFPHEKIAQHCLYEVAGYVQDIRIQELVSDPV